MLLGHGLYQALTAHAQLNCANLDHAHTDRPVSMRQKPPPTAAAPHGGPYRRLAVVPMSQEARGLDAGGRLVQVGAGGWRLVQVPVGLNADRNCDPLQRTSAQCDGATHNMINAAAEGLRRQSFRGSGGADRD